MNPLVVRIIFFLVITLGSGFYILNLNSTIDEKDAKILSLEVLIDKQNTSIEKAGDERKQLVDVLEKTSIINRHLVKALDKNKTDIDNRPDAKSCEEAVNFLSGTAKSVAEEWNKK